MLTSYLTQVTRLLQNPSVANLALYATADLTAYINQARGQIAGEGECVRVYGTLALTGGTLSYPFSAISVDPLATLGIQGVFNVRGATVGVAMGQAWMRPRSFPYFQLYFLNNPVPVQDRPVEYSQYGQGESGSLYFNPVPNIPYTASLDCVCAPAPLVDDTTPEALPYPWTDCVQYFAAYMALLSAQRTSDADAMFSRYQTFMTRARTMSNGKVNPGQYPQSPNPTRPNQLGVSAGGAG
jgi:hypothetical protein